MLTKKQQEAISRSIHAPHVTRMRSAVECAPKKCSCGRKLGKPTYGYPWAHIDTTTRFKFERVDYGAPIREKVWYIKCDCHLRHVWSFHRVSNGCWKIRSDLPLLDTQAVTVIA